MQTIYTSNISGLSNACLSEALDEVESVLSDYGRQVNFVRPEDKGLDSRFRRIQHRRWGDLPPFVVTHDLLSECLAASRLLGADDLLLVVGGEILTGFPPMAIDGMAFPPLGFFAVSTLQIWDTDSRMLRSRLQKLVLHEVGHLNGLVDHPLGWRGLKSQRRNAARIGSTAGPVQCVMEASTHFVSWPVKRVIRTGLQRIDGVPLYDLRPSLFCEDCAEKLRAHSKQLREHPLDVAFMLAFSV